MREQKYANILREYEKELEINEKEESLSMTRELKFKELHEAIENQNETRSKRADKFREIVVEESDADDDIKMEEENADVIAEEEEEITQLAKKLNSNREEKIEEKEVNNVSENVSKNISSVDDDIYLTTSFKPPKLSFRLKKGVKKLLYVFIFFSLVGMLAFFVGLPAYKKYTESRPKMIFDGTVDYISNKLVGVIEKVYSSENVVAGDVLFNFNSNLESLRYINDSKLGIELNVDSKNKVHQSKVYSIDDEEKYSFNYIYNNANNYYHYSTSDKYIELKNSDISEEYYGYLNNYLDGLSEIQRDDLIYFVETEQEVIKELLEASKIKSSKDELDIGGKTVKVTKNSFEIDEKDYERLFKRYNEKVLNDKVLLKVEAFLAQKDIEEYSNLLKRNLNSYHKLKINIYTVNGTEVVGFDIEKDGFTNIYYYNYEDAFKFHLNFASKLIIGKDNTGNQKVIDLVGSTNNNQTSIVVKYNTKDIGFIKIKELNDKRLEFEYEVEIKKNKYYGNSLFYVKSEDEADIDLSVKHEEKFINLNVNISNGVDYKYEKVDASSIFKYSDRVFDDEKKKLLNMLSEEDMRYGFEYWNRFWANPTNLVSELNKLLIEEMVGE